jgi:hypothetical protein
VEEVQREEKNPTQEGTGMRRLLTVLVFVFCFLIVTTAHAAPFRRDSVHGDVVLPTGQGFQFEAFEAVGEPGSAGYLPVKGSCTLTNYTYEGVSYDGTYPIFAVEIYDDSNFWFWFWTGKSPIMGIGSYKWADGGNPGWKYDTVGWRDESGTEYTRPILSGNFKVRNHPDDGD